MFEEKRGPRWVCVFAAAAGGFLLSAGCCATCYRHAGLEDGMVGPGAVYGPPRAVHAYHPGPLSGLWRVLGIGDGYPCEDCGPRYWGDWGGDRAHCEPCDEYGRWIGPGTGSYAEIAQSAHSVVAQPGSECEECRGDADGAGPDRTVGTTEGRSSVRQGGRVVGSSGTVSGEATRRGGHDHTVGQHQETRAGEEAGSTEFPAPEEH